METSTGVTVLQVATIAATAIKWVSTQLQSPFVALSELHLDTRYYVHDNQSGGRQEVLPPISSFFGPAISPVDWPRVTGNAPAPRQPSPGTSMPPPPPPGLVHPGSFAQTPTTTQAPATTQQSRLSTEGTIFLPSVTFSSTNMDLLQAAASSTSLLYWRKRGMKGPRANQSSFAKKSKAVAPVHLIFLARHFPATTSSVKYSRRWDWSIDMSPSQDLVSQQPRFGRAKGRFVRSLSVAYN